MKRMQAGFTMIELIVVIAILGILAAVAMPKFINMKVEAQDAAVAGVAGALSSASAINFAARTAKATNGNAVANCTDVATSLQGGLPTGYTIASTAIAAGVTVTTCSVTAGGSSANFTATGII